MGSASAARAAAVFDQEDGEDKPVWALQHTRKLNRLRWFSIYSSICLRRRLTTASGALRPPAPPGNFCLGKSRQNRSTPKAADSSLRVSPASALAQLAGRARRASGSNTGLATSPPPATLLGQRLQGGKHESCRGLPLGPVWRAEHRNPLPASPTGRGQGFTRRPPGQGGSLVGRPYGKGAKRKGKSRHPGSPLSFGNFFFGEAKKSYLPKWSATHKYKRTPARYNKQKRRGFPTGRYNYQTGMLKPFRGCARPCLRVHAGTRAWRCARRPCA